jgi:hypothetical protein
MADDTAPTGDTPTKKRVGLPPGTMTAEHRQALAEGRRRGRIVRAYLESLQQATRGRGRPITRDGLQKRLDAIDPKITESSDPLEKLDLVQRKIELQRRLKEFDEPVDLTALEDEFVSVAADYGRAKKISPEAWLEMKVPKAVLKRAGIV